MYNKQRYINSLRASFHSEQNLYKQQWLSVEINFPITDGEAHCWTTQQIKTECMLFYSAISIKFIWSVVNVFYLLLKVSDEEMLLHAFEIKGFENVSWGPAESFLCMSSTNDSESRSSLSDIIEAAETCIQVLNESLIVFLSCTMSWISKGQKSPKW